MKLAYPAFSEVLISSAEKITCLVIENKKLFRSFICDIELGINGIKTNVVLSKDDKLLDLAKYAEILFDFINFEINKKTLINRIINKLEKEAVSPENYLKTQELLIKIEQIIGDWSFSFPCDIITSKTSVSALLKAVGIELKNDYDGHRGEIEKIVDYMEYVREFDKDKIFFTINMRSFFDDDLISEFQKTVIAHEYNVIMLDSQAYEVLPLEKRITIDMDLCEF